jgi:enoyl-CoA hydratase/carnithine racemase
MTFDTLLFDIDDGIATVTLHRPDRRNAWTRTMERELSVAMERCDRDDRVRAVILTGAGPAFSVGADLDDPTMPARPGTEASSDERLVHPGDLRKPVIAAIQGDAIGAGTTYPLQCDIRIVAESARLSFAYAKRGLVPGYDSLWLLPRMVGFATALELVLTARVFSGREAVEMGMCHRALPAEDVLAAARETATAIARDTGPIVSALAKRLVWMSGLERDAFRAFERAAVEWCLAGQESTEGITSFLEKRPPVWSQRPSVDLPPWFDEEHE